MKSKCLWCGHQTVHKDFLIYPGKGPVPEVEDNKVVCCAPCRLARQGRRVASWLSDCRESGRSADPQQVYEILRDLDSNYRTSRTDKELKRLREALTLEFNTPIKRQAGLEKMFQRSGRKCIWCGRALAARHLDSSYEHLVPQSKQGSNHSDNLLPACIDCNNRRSNISPGKWIEILVSEGHQPRIDLVWESLINITGPDHGVRMHKRAVEYLDEMEENLKKPIYQDQPFMPDLSVPRPPVAEPKKAKKNYRRPRRRRPGKKSGL